MLGAILGDMVGSPYEFDWNNIKTTEFPLFGPQSEFTDDTVTVSYTHLDVYKRQFLSSERAEKGSDRLIQITVFDIGISGDNAASK